MNLSLTRAGDWTLLGLGPDPNPLLGEFAARIQRDHAPFQASATNGWLEADFNPRLLAAALALDWPLPEDLARVSFSAGGDGATVLEHAQFDFAKPLNLKLEPWTLPAPLVDGQMTSFTAVRGFGPWLASLNAWQEARLGGPPNQAYFWSLQGLPVLSFFAAPQPDASNQVSRAIGPGAAEMQPMVCHQSLAGFQKAKDFNGLNWKGLPSIYPFLKSIAVGNDSFVFAGLFHLPGHQREPPPASGPGQAPRKPRGPGRLQLGTHRPAGQSLELPSARPSAWWRKKPNCPPPPPPDLAQRRRPPTLALRNRGNPNRSQPTLPRAQVQPRPDGRRVALAGGLARITAIPTRAPYAHRPARRGQPVPAPRPRPATGQ